MNRWGDSPAPRPVPCRVTGGNPAGVRVCVHLSRALPGDDGSSPHAAPATRTAGGCTSRVTICQITFTEPVASDPRQSDDCGLREQLPAGTDRDRWPAGRRHVVAKRNPDQERDQRLLSDDHHIGRCGDLHTAREQSDWPAVGCLHLLRSHTARSGDQRHLGSGTDGNEP